MSLRNGERHVQLLEIHDISLKASVSSSVPGDILTRFQKLSADFHSLQEQYTRFQSDFQTLAGDVRRVEGQLSKVDDFKEEIFGVKSDLGKLRASQKMATERSQELERELHEVWDETSRIDNTLTRFEVDHPPAAYLFEKRVDCFGEHEGVYTNALMREHQARLDAEAGGANIPAQEEEKGWQVHLPEGQHTAPDIRDREANSSDQPKAISVSPGFEATLFEFSNLGGEVRHLYEGDHDLEDFPKRLRQSEKDIGKEVEALRKDFAARERAFGDLRNDIIREFDSRGEDNHKKLLSSMIELDRRAAKLEEYSSRCNEDIENLRTTKADKGENKDLPEQVKHLHQVMQKLGETVAEASKTLADKADVAMVSDKVTRGEIQEFSDAIQRLLQIGGPYAYTGRRPNFGDAAIDSEKVKPRTPGKDYMNFEPLPAAPRFKVWSSGLPRQFGGAEAVSMDQSSTALGRGVQLRASPTSPHFGGVVGDPEARQRPRTAASLRRQHARSRSSRDSPELQSLP